MTRFLSQWSTSSLGKTEASRYISLLSLTSSWVTCLRRSGSSGTTLEILFNLTEGAGRRQRVSSIWLRLNCTCCGLSCKVGREHALGDGWYIMQFPEFCLALSYSVCNTDDSSCRCIKSVSFYPTNDILLFKKININGIIFIYHFNHFRPMTAGIGSSTSVTLKRTAVRIINGWIDYINY